MLAVAGDVLAGWMGARGVNKGQLRVYLGAAPGVGKTFAMLSEGRRRVERGGDVVVGLLETHGRSLTAEAAEGLELLPRRTVTYRGARFSELDLDALLKRRPEVALIDELAHTNVPGSRNAQRWQDIQELLDAGINVITTVNVQHLESLNDVVEKITGVAQRETVPDRVVRAADQVELVDMTAEALRRRMAHGNIYAADKVDAALANYFRVGNLTALRELALLWLADKVDDQLDAYRAAHDISDTWEARERVVVALTGGPEGETLIRRAARIAVRSHGDLLAVHVSRADGLIGTDQNALVAQRALVESLGGTVHQVVGDAVPQSLLDFARAENATQLVLGASRRGYLSALLTGPGIGATVTRHSGDIDVHMVTHELVGSGRRMPTLTSGLTTRRRLSGLLVAVVLFVVLTLVLTSLRRALNLPSDILLFLLVVTVAALVGGLYPAVVSAGIAVLVINYYFTPPLHTLTIADRNNALTLVVFVTVAVMVSSLVDLAARRTSQAAAAAAEAQTLSALAGRVLRGDDALPALLERVRETFGLSSVALLEHQDAGGENTGWRNVASVGQNPCTVPGDADIEVPITSALTLTGCGRTLPAADRRILAAFAAQAAVALEQRRLGQRAAEASTLQAATRTRDALLAAVSHDLRSPLASAKAAVSSLRSDDVDWTLEESVELLETADESLNKLITLVENLLDMSRLQAGALEILVRPVALDELVPRALDDIGPDGAQVRNHVPSSLPPVAADPGLLERVVVNLVRNALRYSPREHPPVLTASELAGRVELRIVDQGPGIPDADRERIFAPFQRLGDRDNTTGLGLGLALSRGLTEAMGGTLSPEETPGGGLTMVLSMPSLPTVSAVPAGPVSAA